VKKSLIVLGVLSVLLAAGASFADSPVNYNTTEPTEVNLTDLSLQSFNHVEPVLQTDPHKGWWAISLKNMTGVAWSSVVIQAGQTDLVAIVQSATASDRFVDEFDYSNVSVTGSREGTVSYSGSLGTRTYGNGSNGLLWQQAIYSFSTPVNVGQSAKFYVYTDNSYYTGPYASSFNVNLTPVAIPEPGSILALSVGVVGLLGFMRKRKS
jgi:hypothetical protein